VDTVERIAAATERIASAVEKQPGLGTRVLTTIATIAGGASMVSVADILIKWITGG
jgi:hypothetical protein